MKKFYHLLSSLGQYKTNKAKKSSNIALPILEAIVVCLSNVIFDVKNEMFDIFLLVLLSISCSTVREIFKRTTNRHLPIPHCVSFAITSSSCSKVVFIMQLYYTIYNSRHMRMLPTPNFFSYRVWLLAILPQYFECAQGVFAHKMVDP